jgi:N-acetylmuramoyl-L-alanine amidase
MAKVILTIGHSSTDPGAIHFDGLPEHQFVKRFVLKLGEKLQEKGFNDFLINPTNTNLLGIINWVNKNSTNKDWLIDFHTNHNEPRASGTELFVVPNLTKKRLEIYSKFLEEVSAILEIPNRGIKLDTSTRHGRLGILRDTNAKAFLWEMIFGNSRDRLAFAKKEAPLLEFVANFVISLSKK